MTSRRSRPAVYPLHSIKQLTIDHGSRLDSGGRCRRRNQVLLDHSRYIHDAIIADRPDNHALQIRHSTFVDLHIARNEALECEHCAITNNNMTMNRPTDSQFLSNLKVAVVLARKNTHDTPYIDSPWSVRMQRIGDSCSTLPNDMQVVGE